MRSDKSSIYRSKIARSGKDSVAVVLSNAGGVTVDRLKALSKKFKYSINDILTCIISMSLGKAPNAPDFVSSVIWVSLEKDYDAVIDPKKWDNSKLGFGYIQLPLGVADPLECLATCHARLRALKASADPLVINKALKCIGRLPRRLGKCISAQTADKASVSMSNLVGPTSQVQWPVNESSGGWPIESLHFATSPPFHFGPLFSVLSYNNGFYLSIAARADMLSSEELNVLANQSFVDAVEALKGVEMS